MERDRRDSISDRAFYESSAAREALHANDGVVIKIGDPNGLESITILENPNLYSEAGVYSSQSIIFDVNQINLNNGTNWYGLFLLKSQLLENGQTTYELSFKNRLEADNWEPIQNEDIKEKLSNELLNGLSDRTNGISRTKRQLPTINTSMIASSSMSFREQLVTLENGSQVEAEEFVIQKTDMLHRAGVIQFMKEVGSRIDMPITLVALQTKKYSLDKDPFSYTLDINQVVASCSVSQGEVEFREFMEKVQHNLDIQRNGSGYGFPDVNEVGLRLNLGEESFIQVLATEYDSPDDSYKIWIHYVENSNKSGSGSLAVVSSIELFSDNMINRRSNIFSWLLFNRNARKSISEDQFLSAGKKFKEILLEVLPPEYRQQLIQSLS